MKPNSNFIHKDIRFWAVVKLVSESARYSAKHKKGVDAQMKIYTPDDIFNSLEKLNIPKALCFDENNAPTTLASEVIVYLNYRSDIIQNQIKHRLMNREQAKEEFDKLQIKFPDSKVKIQINKQTAEKRHPSYLVCMVNLIAESVFGDGFDHNPMKMGVITDKEGPLFTLCRRMDGAYPSTFKPKLIWEVKEYYGTTTFGSRIADGVYETSLVGEELKHLLFNYKIKINHALFVDDYFTWWIKGRSYLCRLIDMMHIGNVDEVFFGKEVLTEWEPFLRKIKALPS